MPVTFHLTRDQKPLVVIYNETINSGEVQTLFSGLGFQQPELITADIPELSERGIPDQHRIVIFANRREQQQNDYHDPTLAEIFDVLEIAQIYIALDKKAEQHLKAVLAFPKNVSIQANSLGMTLEEFTNEHFKEGDLISPLLPGLEEFLQKKASDQHPALNKTAPHATHPTQANANFFMTLSRPARRALIATTSLLLGIATLQLSAFTLTGTALIIFGLFALISASRSRNTEHTSTFQPQQPGLVH